MLDSRSFTSDRNANPAAGRDGLINIDLMIDSPTCHSRETCPEQCGRSDNPEGFSNTPQPKPNGRQSLVVTHRSRLGWISVNLAHFHFFGPFFLAQQADSIYN
jgi:hypothetical protein